MKNSRIKGYLPVIDGEVIATLPSKNKGLLKIKTNRIKKMRKIKAEQIQQNLIKDTYKVLKSLSMVILLFFFCSTMTAQKTDNFTPEFTTVTDTVLISQAGKLITIIDKNKKQIFTTGIKTSKGIKRGKMFFPIYKAKNQYFYIDSRNNRLTKTTVKL